MPPDPVTVVFDTSAAHCAAAVFLGDRMAASDVQSMKTGQSEELFPMIGGCLSRAARTWQDVTRIAVGTGPGNFTGTRIAVSAARGLALSLGIPAIGVSRLQALAYGVQQCRAIVAAHRGHVFWQDFPAGDPVLCALEELPEAEGPQRGDAGAAGLLSGVEAVPVDTMLAAMSAIAQATEDAPRPAPLYLRAPDAAPPSDPPPVILP